MLKNMARTQNFWMFSKLMWLVLKWLCFEMTRLFDAINKKRQICLILLNFVFFTVMGNDYMSQVTTKSVRLVWEISHILWSIVTCLGSWTILLDMCNRFSASFASIPKYVYFSYSKTLKQWLMMKNSDQWCRNTTNFQTLAPRWQNLSLAQTQAVIKPMCTFSGLKGSNSNSFHIELYIVRAVIKRRRLGIFPGYFQLLSKESRRKIEPKGTPNCLIPCPTCCIYLATWNLSDNPAYWTYLAFIPEVQLPIYSRQVIHSYRLNTLNCF